MYLNYFSYAFYEIYRSILDNSMYKLSIDYNFAVHVYIVQYINDKMKIIPVLSIMFFHSLFNVLFWNWYQTPL